MIQEKDFLYRVPVKTAPITTPGGQIRNPEILVDIEGGEFMHGNILDANSTNKLINQSVDDKITEGGYVTKNLLDAETARATAKENQIKAQVDIINGDSTTEGSFRKAIADVVAAAPEDLDTLKEIADKLAGNDDLHTALNQAITEKADASALLNEVARATGVENNLKATLVNYALNSDVEEKLAQKADTTMLSEFIDKTSTEEQAINSPLHAKEYISVFHNTADGASGIKITPLGFFSNQNDAAFTVCNANDFIHIKSLVDQIVRVQPASLYCSNGTSSIDINSTGISLTDDDNNIRLSRSGVILPDGNSNYVLTSAGSTINIAEYATKSDLSSQINPKADRSDLIALEKKITANTTAIEGKQDKGNYVTYNSKDDDGYYFDKFFTLNDGQLAVFDGTELKTTITGVGVQINSISDNEHVEINAEQASFVSDGKAVSYGSNGINSSKYPSCIPTTDGTFKPIDDFALKTDIAPLPTNIVTASAVSDRYFGFEKAIEIYSEAINKIMTIGYTGINFQTNKNDVAINEDGFFISSDSDDTDLCSFTTSGIKFAGKTSTDIPTANGGFISLSDLANKEDISSLSAGISAKQNKITVNSVDVTDIETADAEKLRTIVTDLTNALSESGLIRLVKNVE